MNFKKNRITNPLLCLKCIPNKTKFLKTHLFSNNITKRKSEETHQCPDCQLDYIHVEDKLEIFQVKSAEKCANCNSTHIEKISKPNADLALYFCKQCRCYMGMEK